MDRPGPRATGLRRWYDDVRGPICQGPYPQPVERQPCLSEGCFATLDGSPARIDEVRHCNRAGPDGGHPHRWDGTRWLFVVGTMQHDRS
jgi:hypothetical protein